MESRGFSSVTQATVIGIGRQFDERGFGDGLVNRQDFLVALMKKCSFSHASESVVGHRQEPLATIVRPIGRRPCRRYAAGNWIFWARDPWVERARLPAERRDAMGVSALSV